MVTVRTFATPWRGRERAVSIDWIERAWTILARLGHAIEIESHRRAQAREARCIERRVRARMNDAAWRDARQDREAARAQALMSRSWSSW